MTSKVLVVVPVHNEERFLDSTIQSVLSQSYTDFTLVVSCNGCTDNSLGIATSYQQADSRVLVFQTQQLISSFDHWRFILDVIPDKSSYGFCLNIGAHDIISVNYLEALIRVLIENSALSMCYPSEAVAIDLIGRFKFRYPPMPQTYMPNDFFQSIPLILSVRYNILAFGLYRASTFFNTALHKCYAADHIRNGLIVLDGTIKSVHGPIIQVRDTSSGHAEYNNKHFGDRAYSALPLNIGIQLSWIKEICERLGPTNNPVLNQAAKSAATALFILRYIDQFDSVDSLRAFLDDKKISTFFLTLSRLSDILNEYIDQCLGSESSRRL